MENEPAIPAHEPQSSNPLPPRENSAIKQPKEHGKQETGPVVGIIIIIVVIILGGLYVWGARLSKTETEGDAGSPQTAEEIAQNPDPALDNLNTQETSDELSAIEDDLDATVLKDLDAELGTVQKEF